VDFRFELQARERCARIRLSAVDGSRLHDPGAGQQLGNRRQKRPAQTRSLNSLTPNRKVEQTPGGG